MKTKSVDTKITSLVKIIKSLFKKGNKSKGVQTKAVLQDLKTNLEKTLGLQKDVKNLKSSLKSKKKELKAGVVNLKKGTKKVKKARKLDKKSLEHVIAEKKPTAKAKASIQTRKSSGVPLKTAKASKASKTANTAKTAKITKVPKSAKT